MTKLDEPNKIKTLEERIIVAGNPNTGLVTTLKMLSNDKN